MKLKQRDLQMDALRGLAIVLVVIGHTLEGLPNFDANIAFRVIYAFHMPLFMVVSGFVAAYSSRPMNLEFLRQKFLMLVVPFVAWYGLSYYLNGTYHQMGLHLFVKRVVLSPDWGLWFLWVLFINFCLLAIARQLEQRIGVVAYGLVWLAVVVQPINYFGLSLVRWHFGFFVLGFLLLRYKSHLARFKSQLMAASLIGFPVLVSFWYRTLPPTFSGALERWAATHRVMPLAHAVIGLYGVAVPLLGIGFSYCVISLFRGMAIERLFAWLGLYTLDIYVSHQYVIRYAFGPGPVKLLTGIGLAFGVSLGLSFLVLRRVKLLDQILLGGRSGPNPADPLFRRFAKPTRAWWLALRAQRAG